MAANNRRDLAVICLWAIVAPMTMTAPDLLRLPACLPWVFALPGYAALRALGMRTKSRLKLGLFTVGLSLALAIAGGFLLNAFEALTQAGWAVWLSAVTLALAGIAARRNEPAGWSAQALPRPPGLGPPRLSRRHYGLLAAAVLAAGAALLLAVRDDLDRGAFARTDFWMVPAEGTSPAFATLGIHNAEGRAHDFQVEMMAEGRVVATWRSLRLDPGETVTWTAPLPPSRPGGGKVEARLFKDDAPSRIYRRVWLSLDR